MLEGVKKIGVVGAGAMGAGVAQTFAAASYPAIAKYPGPIRLV
ncbi:MAG TPA: 3-hydroxyacyl-CoA dehydrogenase NAD-binding domain-containing protein [Roseiarcus sp.]|nr:3-hydroxyacyl-CoA dehydrogenase NAD-binding domain-containing protein [Roseiarcus sp.]